MRKSTSADSNCLDDNFLDMMQDSSNSDIEFDQYLADFANMKLIHEGSSENCEHLHEMVYPELKLSTENASNINQTADHRIKDRVSTKSSMDDLINNIISFKEIKSFINIQEFKDQIKSLIISEKGSKSLQASIHLFPKGSLSFIYETVSP